MISSKDNEKYKYLKSLSIKKYRDKEGVFLIEGDNILEEGKGFIKYYLGLEDGDNTIGLSKNLLSSLSSLKTSNEPLALAYKPKAKKISTNTILVIDDVNDPLNMGTILRSALAFNIKDVLVSKTSVDIYNPKVIRGSEGAIFKLNIIICDLEEEIIKLKKEGYKALVTDVKEGSLEGLKHSKKLIIIGNEGRGVSPSIRNLKDEYLNIKINNIDSLNVSIATSIILYENSLN